MTLQIKELLNLREILIHKSCLSCTNGHCRVSTKEKVGLEDGQPAGSMCIGWKNPKIEEKAKRLKIYDVYQESKTNRRK